MKKLSFFLLLAFCSPLRAEPTKTTFNPFTGKPDFITKIDSNTIVPGANITVTCTSGACTINSIGSGGTSSLETMVNNVRISSPTNTQNFVSGEGITVSGTLPAASSAAITVSLNPATTDFIHNQKTLQSGATAYPDFVHVGTSATVEGPGGLNLTYGVTAASATFLTSVAATSPLTVTNNASLQTAPSIAVKSNAISPQAMLFTNTSGAGSDQTIDFVMGASIVGRIDSATNDIAISAGNGGLNLGIDINNSTHKVQFRDTASPTDIGFVFNTNGNDGEVDWENTNNRFNFLNNINVPNMTANSFNATSTSMSVTGSGGFNSTYSVSGATMSFTAFNTTVTSATATGSAGLTVKYNVTVGSATVQNLGTNTNVCTDGSSNLTTSGCNNGTLTSAYATVDNAGSALTQRSILNFTGTGVTCVDNAGNTRTDCTITAGGGSSASTLAIGTGTSSGWTGVITSSPVSVGLFDQSQFTTALQGGATSFIRIQPSVSNISANFTIGSTTTVVIANCSAACTVTLPTAVGITGITYTVKIIGTGATSVTTTSAQTIDGSTTITPLPNQYASFDIISDGSNWEIK